MRIGFTGVHGIGKSTTAIALTKLLPGFLYMPSQAGKLAQIIGYNLNEENNAYDILQYQKLLLEAASLSYDRDHRDTIYDRTPIDFIAYLITCEPAKGCEKLEEGIGREQAHYVNACLEKAAKAFDVIVWPQSDLTAPYEDKYNRPVFSEEEINNRIKFNALLGFYLAMLKCRNPNLTIIEVPSDLQYDARTNFIYNKVRFMA